MARAKEPDFEASADMRLVQLQRSALGIAPAQRSAWESHVQADGSSVDPERLPELHSAVVSVDMAATPEAEVIPGAVVTIALSVANEGAAAAQNVRVCVPPPGGAAYRAGSFVRDGRAMLDDAAEELFGAGTLIRAIAPKSRVTFVWKIGVRLGNKPLVIAPVVTAEETAVVGAQPLLVSRRPEAQTGFAAHLEQYDRLAVEQPVEPAPSELPIYELDAEEIIEHAAADGALSPIRAEYQPPMEPPLQPVPPPDQPGEPAPPVTQPSPVPEPGVPEQEPYVPEPPQQPPDIEPAAQLRQAVVLYGRIDRPSVAYFERIFLGPKPPALLNHFILGGALACTRSLSGDDDAGLKAHVDAQGHLLQRVVLHEKIGKTEPIAGYAGTMLGRIDRLMPAPVAIPEAPHDRNSILLETELDAPTLALLARMQDDVARWDFTKARQFTLALQARRIIADAPAEKIEAAQTALRAYTQTAAVQLQRFFVRMRIDRTTGLLFAHDEALDAAARTLIHALTRLFSSL